MYASFLKIRVPCIWSFLLCRPPWRLLTKSSYGVFVAALSMNLTPCQTGTQAAVAPDTLTVSKSLCQSDSTIVLPPLRAALRGAAGHNGRKARAGAAARQGNLFGKSA
jgi:hypothetical protein